MTDMLDDRRQVLSLTTPTKRPRTGCADCPAWTILKLAEVFNEVYQSGGRTAGNTQCVEQVKSVKRQFLKVMVTLTNEVNGTSGHVHQVRAEDQGDDREQGPRQPTIPAQAGQEITPTMASDLHGERGTALP